MADNEHWILRLTHVDNLDGFLRRGSLHSPNHSPDDGIGYRKIHHATIQSARREVAVPCGPGGVFHDYVPFYFGPLSPMLYALHTGYVAGYDEGQQPLIYIATTAEAVSESGARYESQLVP